MRREPDMKTFIKYSTPVIIFFILGDLLTTLWGLQAGFIETNPIMAGIVSNRTAFLAAKLSILPALYILYKKTESKTIKNLLRHSHICRNHSSF